MKAKTLDEQTQKPRRGGSRSGRKIVRLPLGTLAGLIKEAGAVYRKMRAGKMRHEEGRSLVWVLGQMRSMVEALTLERLEARLAELGSYAEQHPHGQQDAARPAGAAHRTH